MNDPDKNEYNEIKSQLKEIKSIMNVSSSDFRLIYAADNFQTFFIFAGVFSLLLPLIYQALIWGYGSIETAPVSLLWGIYILIALCWCLLVFIRTKKSIDEAKKLGVSSNIFMIVKHVLATKLWLAIIPLLIIFVLLPIKNPALLEPYGYIPYIGMSLGLMLNIMGIMINEKEYSLCGIWMLISAAVLFFIAALPGHIAFLIIFAPGCFLFAAVNKYMRNRHEAS